MNRHIIISFYLFLAVCISSCAYHNEEDLYPCNIPATVSYSQTIVPILQANCYECHDNANFESSQVLLEGYSNLEIKAVGGQLIYRITNTDIAVRMPRGRPPLDTCDIRKIINWVNEGAKDN